MSCFTNYIQLYLTTSQLNTFLLTVGICSIYTSYWRIWLVLFFSYQGVIYAPQSIVFGLQNSLAAIHPLLILGLYSILFKVFFNTKFFLSYNHMYFYTNLGFITLALGGLWAFQEFNWGGWWNWDSIETPVLILFLSITIMLFHSFVNNINKLSTGLNKLRYLKGLMFLFLLIIYLPRFGMTNSVHAFISSTTTYTYYLSINLLCTIQLNFLYRLIQTVSLWTFFFIKILLIWIIIYMVVIQLFKNRYNNYRMNHKIIYIIIFGIMCVNYKHFPVYFYFVQSVVWSDIIVNKIFWLSNLNTNEFIFWYKPSTGSMSNLYISLRNFLN